MKLYQLLAPYGTAITLYISLNDPGTGNYKASPTIASGDFKLSKAGGAEANPGTLPAVDGTNTKQVNVVLTAIEMQATRVRLRGEDQTSPADWEAVEVVIETYGHASAGNPTLGWNTGDAFARLGVPTGPSVSADIASVGVAVAGVQSDTDNLQSRIPTTLVGGRMDAYVGEVGTDVIDADSLKNDAVAEIQSGLSTLTPADVTFTTNVRLP